MLGRYKIHRGKRSPQWPPRAQRQDSRKHTRHCLRPAREVVEHYLADPTDEAWQRFRHAYLQLLRERFDSDRAPFDALAQQAQEGDVYLGCSCPTKRNPDLNRCHTLLALAFMQQRYPKLRVTLPEGVALPRLDRP